MAFFASPAKLWLVQKLKERNQYAVMDRATSHEQQQQQHPLMGLPSDPAGDIDDAVKEIREEVEMRKRRGSRIGMPTGNEMRAAVEEKLGQKIG